MKNILQFMAIAVLLCAMLVSCHKDAVTTTTGNTYTSVNDFIQRNGAAAQTFTLDATNGGTFTGAKGTVFTFPAGAFVTAAGQPVTGNVTVTLKEIYSNADMIFSNKTTVAAGNIPLISGGEFYLNVSQNGQRLHIAPFKNYQAVMNADTAGLDYPNVYHNNNGDTTANVVWVQVQDSATYVSNGGGCTLYGDSVNWINCDGVFPGGGAYYQITANATGCPDPTNTLVYVFVNGHHAVWALNNSGGSQFQTPTDIVAGVPVTIVGYCVSGGKVYSAFMPVTASSNQTITLNFTQTTDVAFKAAVTALN